MEKETDTDCPICETPSVAIEEDFAWDISRYQCLGCGTFDITQEFCVELSFEKQRDPKLLNRIARYLYETREKGLRLLTSDPARRAEEYAMVLDLKQATNLYKTDLSPLQKYNKTLLNVAIQTRRFGEFLEGKEHPYIVPSFDVSEREDILAALQDNGYLEFAQNNLFRITYKGLSRVEGMIRTASTGSVVFVACSFKDELESARTVIEETVKDLGYAAYIVIQDPHNEIIDLQIYEHIRQSIFMVADLTYNRQSVYYEVGFAHGLGLDVILTCREDSFKDPEDDSKRIHFDLNHRKVLIWKDEKHLQDILHNHILQSFGRFMGDKHHS